jgi:hypothetical protein
MPTKVYKYGLLAPTENVELMRQQMRLAHAYRNKLVEFARAERGELRAIELAHGNIAALVAAAKVAADAAAQAYDAMKQHRATTRGRAVPDSLRAAHETAVASRNAAFGALYEARDVMFKNPEFQAQTTLVREKYYALRREARAVCGVYWGTYLCIEASDHQARQKPIWNPKRPYEPDDPRFVPWTGEGIVGAQIQKGRGQDPEDLTRCNYVRIEPAAFPPKADPTSKKTASRRYCTLALRVGSEGREPIWTRWLMIMHRPLPEDAKIAWVKVTARKVGFREVWEAHFTVKTSVGRRHLSATDEQNRVAIDIGWRVREDGLRVAAWRSDSGERGFLMLDERVLNGFEIVEGLVKTRAENFNTAKATLLGLLPGLQLPDWFPKNIYQWESAARLAVLAKRWKDNRFAGDDLAYAMVEAWRYRDHHLREYETGQRENNLQFRTDFYRKFAARMARKYSSLVLEGDMDLRDFAKRPSVVEADEVNETSRRFRFIAAVGDLRGCLLEAFYGDVSFVPAAYTTRTCSACGAVEKWDQAAEVEHTCSQCGAVWDQDDNATMNLLSYREQPGDAENLGPARKRRKSKKSAEMTESKWQRLKRLREEKTKVAETARKEEPNAAE